MKKILLLLAMSFIVSDVCEAKYTYPKDVPTGTERMVNRRMRNYDKDGTEGMSLEEYQDYRKTRTYYERQQERRAKRDGSYVSPEDAFKQMDADGDGVVSRDEMLSYEKKKLEQQKK